MNVSVAAKAFQIQYSFSKSVIISIMLLVTVGLVILYMYLLSMSVVHVVIRRELMYSAQVLESTIASLESDFMVAQHTVSGAVIEAGQFTASSDKIFINRRPATVAISD